MFISNHKEMNIKRREKKEETKRCNLFNQMGNPGKQNL